MKATMVRSLEFVIIENLHYHVSLTFNHPRQITKDKLFPKCTTFVSKTKSNNMRNRSSIWNAMPNVLMDGRLITVP